MLSAKARQHLAVIVTDRKVKDMKDVPEEWLHGEDAYCSTAMCRDHGADKVSEWLLLSCYSSHAWWLLLS